MELKIVLVGDGAVGKTSLLSAYRNPEDSISGYIPTVLENFQLSIPIDNQDLRCDIWDTAGQEGMGELRTLAYPNTDVFLFCYDVSTLDSFANLGGIWFKETVGRRRKKNEVNPGFMLVGTKLDLGEAISEATSVGFCKKFGGSASVRCSAKKLINVNRVFKTAFVVGMKRRDKREETCCLF